MRTSQSLSLLLFPLYLMACPGGPGPGSPDLAVARDLRPAPDLHRQALRPVAPSAGHFGWQGLQTQFQDADGTPCTGAVTIALGDQVTCYVGADNGLKCAGVVYMKDFGPHFTDAGQSGVDQVLIGGTANIAHGNQLCIHKVDGTAWCVGYGNVIKSTDFTQWGTLNNLAAIGTGTFDQLCGIDRGGKIYCSGFGIGAMPVLQDGGKSHSTFWVDTFGKLQADDASVLRASAGRTECQVQAGGLHCFAGTFGTAGSVVDGNEVMAFTAAGGQVACWLSADGKVTCAVQDMMGHMTMQPLFTAGTVLAIAANYYAGSMCAVYNDGSLACIGNNDQGQLGSGDMKPLAAETVVQPTGSVRINCH